MIDTEELHSEIISQIDSFRSEKDCDPTMIIINHKTFALFVNSDFNLDVSFAPTVTIHGIELKIITNSDVPYMTAGLR